LVLVIFGKGKALVFKMKTEKRNISLKGLTNLSGADSPRAIEQKAGPANCYFAKSWYNNSWLPLRRSSYQKGG